MGIPGTSSDGTRRTAWVSGSPRTVPVTAHTNVTLCGCVS
jgi:hypothetical protein